MTFGIVLGIFLGVTLGLNLIIRGIKKSNDLGDSKASFQDFSASYTVTVINSADKVNRHKYTNYVKQPLPPDIFY